MIHVILSAAKNLALLAHRRARFLHYPLREFPALRMTVVTCLCVAPIYAQVPPAAQIQSDLAGPFFCRAPQPQISHRSEVTDQIKDLIMQQAGALTAKLQPWGKDPSALLIGPGMSDENSIRPNAHIAMTLAVMARCMMEGYPSNLSRHIARDKAIAILRFLLPTHGAGALPANDNKLWHNQWQSAYWAYSAGIASWLLWDHLDPRMKWLAARMICDEADRFVNQKPPAQVANDTKAEENAWDSTVIALAFNMFPKHPHHDKWASAAIQWSGSAFVRESDVKTDLALDGRPLRMLVTGPTIHDDYTLENHNRVHPDYMSTITINGDQRLIYEWGDHKPPQALLFNAKGIYDTLKKLAFPDGGFLYPNGQDWQLHRQADWLNLHAMADVSFDDPQAARLLRIDLETVVKMAARDPHGTIVSPTEPLWPATEPSALESMAFAWLLLTSHGERVAPTPEDQLWLELSGRFIFDAGKFAILRTPHAVSSFSWGAQKMGMVLPMQKDLLLTPYPRGLVGTITADGVKGDPIEVEKVVLPQTNDAMAILGILKRAGGKVEQRFGFVSLLDGRTIYVDAIAAPEPVKLTALDLVPIGVLNDASWPWHNGMRTIYHAGNAKDVFKAAEASSAKPVTMKSPWYDIDNKLGIVCLQTPGAQIYDPHPTAAKGRLEQLFHLNQIDVTKPEPTTRGPLATSAVIFYPNERAKETGQYAKKCQLGFSTGASIFRITLEDGSQINIDLNDLKLTIELKQEQ